MSQISRRYTPAGNTCLAARIRADALVGQLPVCIDGETQEQLFVVHEYGPDPFDRANLLIVDTVPLAEYHVLSPLSQNPELFAAAYIRSYIRWFDTRRLQIAPYSGIIRETRLHRQASSVPRPSPFPSREVIIAKRLRHILVSCLAPDMRAETHYDIPFFSSSDERFWCQRVWPDVLRVFEGRRMWCDSTEVNLAFWEGLHHECAFNNPFRFGQDFDLEVHIRLRHCLFTGYHNMEVPRTVRSLLHAGLTDNEFRREVSRDLLVLTPRKYV